MADAPRPVALGRSIEEELARAGAKLDHVAVAAPRIRELLPLYRDVLGGRFVLGGDNPRVGYRGLQLCYANGSKIELLEPLRGSAFLDSFFRRGGGVHHLAFEVADLDAIYGTLEASGHRLTGLHRDDPWRQEVFIHPKSAQGVLVQLVQVAAENEPDLPKTLDLVLAGRGMDGSGIPSP
ncbi:VOC family protein [Streptomyces sp. Y7]|uniref:VOC family protein n=1 Tax=Streptomyces sp. Y7 TaxID=3342392 RepID=UPI00371445F8